MQCDPHGQFEVDMGIPDFEPGNVPLTLTSEDESYTLNSPWGHLKFGAVSIGNPHALVLVDDVRSAPVAEMGAYLSTHEVFPEGCNAGFAEMQDRDNILLRVFERGTGETLACGSGACAAMAILRRADQVNDRVVVALPGGDLVIKWPRAGNHLRMKGPATHVFRGTLNE
jgi:diaminopimelate epimerase